MKHIYNSVRIALIAIITCVSINYTSIRAVAQDTKADSLRALAGKAYATSSPDSLLLEDFAWLKHFGEITDVKRLPVAKQLKSSYSSKYVFFITQPIDHKNPSLGSFKQRVIVAFAGFDKPVSFITEGYTATYGLNPRYNEEIAKILHGNFVMVEHRYFGESVPFIQKGNGDYSEWCALNWDYMTAEQEAADLHQIREILHHLFQGKWIATGISKGGENCMAYTSFYPQDIDVSVPYVGPVSRAQEDGRHEPFLRDSVGTAEDRARIFAFQNEILDRRVAMESLLEEFTKKNKLTFNITIPELLDFCVLEMPFAFWQWGRKTADIPSLQSSDTELFSYLVEVTGPDYFQRWDASAPFFVQAAKELGYYGYDYKPFKKKLAIKTSKGYLRRIFMPCGRKFKFDKALYERITDFVATTGSKMMFIYGQWDPWSSARVQNPGHENIKYYLQPEGSHRARILNMPEATKNEAITTLKKWLNMEPNN